MSHVPLVRRWIALQVAAALRTRSPAPKHLGHFVSRQIKELNDFIKS